MSLLWGDPARTLGSVCMCLRVRVALQVSKEWGRKMSVGDEEGVEVIRKKKGIGRKQASGKKEGQKVEGKREFVSKERRKNETKCY